MSEFPATSSSLTRSNGAKQLDLFTELNLVAGADHTSTIELFDAIPKYLFSTQGADVTAPILKEFVFRKEIWKLSLTPATFSNTAQDGLRSRFPGPREEIVEQVLRKMASENLDNLRETEVAGGGKIIRLVTTLSNIRRRLAEAGHGYKLSEVDEALTVMDGARIDLTGRLKIKTSGIIRRETVAHPSDSTGERTAVSITFHPLFYNALANGEYRLLKYDRLMRLKMPLSRWLYGRIMHNFSQARRGGAMSGMPYNIALSFMLQGTAMRRYPNLRDNKKQVCESLAELKKEGILDQLRPYTEDIRYAPQKGRGRPQIMDVVWDLYVSDPVAEEIIEINTRLKKGGGGKLPDTRTAQAV